jgi:hypothetical protein
MFAPHILPPPEQLKKAPGACRGLFTIFYLLDVST